MGPAAGAALSAVPAHVLADKRKKSPNEKLNLAAVGVAGMGSANLANVGSENVVALCDVDSKYAAGVFDKYSDAKVWTDFRRMLEKQKEIDGVIIATPDHLHAAVSKAAMEAGKHVYTQKPLTRTVEEARVLRETAQRTGVATQMGNQGHSDDAVRKLREWIEDGAIGPVREVHSWTHSAAGMWPQGIGRPKSAPSVPSHLNWDLWLGPAPERPYHPVYHPNRWRGWWAFGNGAIGDMGCHILDAPFYALQLGAPTSVAGSYSRLDGRGGSYRLGQGFDLSINIEDEEFPVQTSCTGPDAETAPIASVIRYRFPQRGSRPPVKLTWWDGGLKPAEVAELGHPDRGSGTLFIGEKGSISCNSHSGDIVLRPKSREQEYERPPAKYQRVSAKHEQDWIRAAKGGRPACSNFDYAVPLTEIVLLGNVALRTGQRIEWDSKGMKASNTDEADRYIRASYRKGWSL